MERVTEKTFERTEVVVDGKHFEGCRFDGCSLAHRGSADVTFERCTFKDCEWIFDGARERTLTISG